MSRDSFVTAAMSNTNVRKTAGGTPGPTHRAYALEARFVDGRSSEGLSWAWFQFYDFKEDNGTETLRILFTHRLVIVTGTYLRILVRKIEDEDLVFIQEIGRSEADELHAANATREEKDRMPVIRQIDTFPDMDVLVDRIKQPME